MARLVELLESERRTIVDQLLCLAEVERRDVHREMGHSSMFAFCTERLKMPKSSAYRRSAAARLIVQFPIALEYLRDGRLSVRTLVELRDVLNDENHRVLFDRAAGKTQDQVRELVVCLNPMAAPRDVVVPVRASANVDLFACDQSQLGSRRELDEVHAMTAMSAEDGSRRELEPASAARELRASNIEPVTAELRRMHVTVSREFIEDLEKVKALLSHVVPGGNLEEVLHACIKKTIEVCEKRRRGSDAPRPRTIRRAPKGRTIPTDVRREVWKRDQGKCTFKGSDGTRCNATHFIQFHHIAPYRKDGPPTVSNVTLHCAAHNDYEAKREYGDAYLEMVKRRRKEQKEQGALPRATGESIEVSRDQPTRR
jgi:5-methylcytosine-specific restriction endonuclease McrA